MSVLMIIEIVIEMIILFCICWVVIIWGFLFVVVVGMVFWVFFDIEWCEVVVDGMLGLIFVIVVMIVLLSVGVLLFVSGVVGFVCWE